MKTQGFENLVVWQKGHNLVLEVYQATKKFPREEKFGLTSQIRRSSVSICANIAEGCRKRKKEFARFTEISQGSLQETKYYLILSKDLRYLTQQESDRLVELADEVGKMLSGLQNSLF